MPDKSDQTRVQSLGYHGHGHSQERQHTSHRVARVGRKSQKTNLLAASENLGSTSQNLAQAAAQALTSAADQKVQVSGTSPQSLQEALSTSNALQRFNAEPTRNKPNIRPMSIQMQRYGPVSAKVATSSQSMSKVLLSTRSAQINGGNANTYQLANNYANIPSSQASYLSSNAIEDNPGYIDPTQVLNPYHKDHTRRRNEASLATKAQDARAQPQSNALNSDVQADQAAKTGSNVAAEMKALLDKMNVLRQKDPPMFQKLLEQKLWDEAGSLADSPATSVVQSSFPGNTKQVQSPVSQKAVATSAHTAVKAFSQFAQPKGLELKEKTTERSAVNLTAAGGQSSPSSSTGGGSGSLRPPGSASTDAPATVPAVAASGHDELIKKMRTTVAKTTVEVLQSVPENNGIDITTDEIYSMLEHNPPYVQLCDNLEKRGLKFRRVHLARQLVASVPSLSKSNKGKVTAVSPSTSPMAPPATTTVPVPTTRPALLVPADDDPVTGGSWASPTVAAPISSQTVVASCTTRASTSVRPEGLKQVNRVGEKVPSAPPEHSPGPKEMLSRKRDFSELVDLTQLSDNDDYVLSNKHIQIESAPLESRPVEKNQQMANMQHRPLAPRLQKLKGTTHPTDNTRRSGQPQEKKTILTKPINKVDAVRKRYYDPKTVARDILIAAGRHPYQRPLNAHMAPLLDRYINIDSDLSTFDWDAIDPGGPPVPKVAPVDIPAAAPRMGMKWKRHAGHRKQRSQVMALNLPDSDDLQRPALQLHDSLLESELLRKQWLDRLRQADFVRHCNSVAEQFAADVNDVTALQHVADDSVIPFPSTSAHFLPLTKVNMEFDTTPNALFASGRRKGGPHGPKKKNSTSSVARNFNIPPRLDEFEIDDTALPRPSHPIFKCRWKSCGVELHNLVTLRKHVAKLHRPSADDIDERGFSCWWRHCRYLQPDDEGSVVATRTFGTAEAWLEHINEDHLRKVAMEWGDGPNSSPIDSQTLLQDKMRYLSDEHGGGVTPSVSKQDNADLPADAMVFTKPVGDKPEAAAQKAFMKVHRPSEKPGPKSTAEEILRAMEARKAKIGPGIERGGCTLVNEARRATFVQNPRLRRVVDADY
ncbi:hypothetical protein DV736_g5671, partial [Chaetothyriales sp. CBS 134916]